MYHGKSGVVKAILLLFTLMLCVVNSTATPQNQAQSSILNKEILLQYDFSYTALNNYTSLSTPYGVFVKTHIRLFGIVINNPMSDNSKLRISGGDDAYSDDATFADAFSLFIVGNQTAFGLIAYTDWTAMETIINDINSNTNQVTMTGSKTQVLSSHPIETYTMSYNNAQLNQSTSLQYQADTGFLLSGEVFTKDSQTSFTLSGIDNDYKWFDQLNAATSNSEVGLSTNQLVGLIVSILVLALIVGPFVLIARDGAKLNAGTPMKRGKTLPEPGKPLNDRVKAKIFETDRIQTKILDNSGTVIAKNTNNGNITTQDQGFINVAGYGRIRVCCNQTARLNELYCPCGRSVPQKLRDLYTT